MKGHAFGLRLHHSGVAVNVDDEACQAVAFGVYEAETVGMWIVGETYDAACLVGLFESVEEKPFINVAVVEAEYLHGDAVRLAEAGAEDVAIVVSDGDGVASL